MKNRERINSYPSISNYIQEYLSKLTTDEQYEIIKFYYKELNLNGEIDKYILQNKELSELILEEEIYTYLEYFNEKYSKLLQTELITRNLEQIKKAPEEIQLSICAYSLDEELQKYLFEYLEIIEKLHLKDSNEILEWLSPIKNKELFENVYKNNDIFKRLMTKSRPYLRFGWGDIEIFDYSDFSKISEEFQEYILNDLKSKEEYNEQYLELLKQSSDNVKIKYFDSIPEDTSNLIVYYELTKSEEAKEKLMKLVSEKNIYYPKDRKKILSLYPSLLNEQDLDNILLNLDLKDIISYYENNPQLLDAELRKKIENIFINQNKPILGTQYKFLKTNIFSSENNLIIALNNTEAESLLYCCEDEIVYNILKEKIRLNPDMFKKFKEAVGWQIAQKYLQELFEYLDPEVAMHFLTIESIDFIIEKIKENPELAQYIPEPLYSLEESKKYQKPEILFEIMEKIDSSVDLFNFLSFECLMSFNEIDKYFDSIILSINENRFKGYNLSGIYNKFTKEQKLRLLKNLNNYAIIPILYYNENDNELKQRLFNLLIFHQTKIFDLKAEKTFISWISDLDINEYENILNSLNDESILNLFYKDKTVLLERKIMERFANNHCIFTKLPELEEKILYFSGKNQNIVYEDMLKSIKELLKNNPNLYQKIMNNNTISNLKFVDAMEKGTLKNLESYEIFIDLINKNPYVVSTLDFRMLSSDFIQIKGHFIEKVSKYPEIQERILYIKNYSQNYEIFKQILSVISKDENKIFDRKLMKILNHFENSSFNYGENLNEIEINNLIRYILINSKNFQFSKEQLDVSKINPLDFDNEMLNMCDKLLQESKTLDNYKNVFFIKYFDMTYSDAKEFVRMYDNNMEGVSIEDSALDFMQNIKDIIEIDNINMLYELYYSYSPRYTINDVFEIENSFQKAYTKELQQSLFDGNGIEKQITIDDEIITVIEPVDNFKILTHSTNAYSSMPLINDNYYQSWNLSKKTNNHGICTALVSDKCLGLPPLGKEGDGCIFGFTEFSERSVTNIAPYDLCSTNGEYELLTDRPLIYTSSNNMINMTRHSHNECVLERTNLLNNNSVNIQPQYVILTSEMNENNLSNSLKASREMNPPNGLPIIYLDIEKIVLNNKSNITRKMQEFIATKNINCFKELLSDYETVKCTLRTIRNYEFIEVEEIDNLIINYIEFCISLNGEEKNKRLKELETALNEEKRKFDLVVDSGNRIKYIDIKYNEHIQRINDGLNINNDINMEEMIAAKAI